MIFKLSYPLRVPHVLSLSLSRLQQCMAGHYTRGKLFSAKHDIERLGGSPRIEAYPPTAKWLAMKQ